jgi:HEAT repeat protein
VSRVPLFGTSQRFQLENVFVDLTIAADRARSTSDREYWSLMDAELRRRRKLFIRDPDAYSGTAPELGGRRSRRTRSPDELRRRGARAVIAGAPGCGKSTLLRYLALRTLQEDEALPVLLELKSIRSQDLQQANGRLEELLFDKAVAPPALALAERAALRGYFHSRLAAGEAAILLDGLDEVSGEEFFTDLCRAVHHFSAAFPGNRLIISSRPYALQARFDDLEEMEIAPLAPRQIEQFVEHYYGRTAETRNLLEQLRDRPELHELARIPFLLAIMAHLHRQGHTLADDRLELYRQIVRQTTVALDREKMVERFHLLDPDGATKRDFLRQLAQAELFSGTGRRHPQRIVFTGDRIEAAARCFCEAEGIPANQARWLAADAKATPLLREVYTDAWAFAHLTIQEYLAATALVERKDFRDAFCRAYFDPVMVETELLPMALGLLGEEATPLYELLEKLPESLTLASFRLRLRGAGYGAKPDAGFYDTVTRRLVELISVRRTEQTYYLDAVLDAFSGFDRGRLEAIGHTVIPLLASPEKDMRVNAARALGRVGGAAAVTALCAALRSRTNELIWEINKALARIGGEPALDCALRAIKRKSHTQRRAAAITLGLIGGSRAVPALIRALDDDDFLVRWAAVESLGQIGGPHAMTGLLKAQKDDHLNVRDSVISTLGKNADDEIEAALISILQNKDPDQVSNQVRSAAVGALGWRGTERALAAVTDVLRDGNFDLRLAAVRALGRIGGKQAAAALAEALQDKVIALDAAEEIGSVGGSRALAALLDTLQKNKRDASWEYVRAAAARALGQIRGDEALTALVKALEDRSSSVRGSAAKGLGQIGGELAVAGLTRALDDKEMFVRSRAVEALRRIGGADAVAALLHTLKRDDNSYVRWQTAKALGEIGDTAARAGLIEALQDPNEWVRHWARAALEQLDGKPASARLLTAYEEKDRAAYESSAADLLAQRTGPANVAALLAEAYGFNPRARQAAPDILARLDDGTLASGLLQALQHEESPVRARAAALVGYYRHDETTLHELERLTAEDPAAAVKTAAGAAVEQIRLKLTVIS